MALWSRFSLSGRVFIVCSSLALSVSLVGNLILYHGACGELRLAVRRHLESVASTTASQISPDLQRQIRARSDESSAAYKEIKAKLRAARLANPDVRYVYTMRRTAKPGILQFVVDAEEDPKLVSHVGDTYDATDLPEMRSAFNGPAADHNPSEDKWGTWLSGYAPIRGKNGKAEAFVGMDMSLAKLRAAESGLRAAALRNILIAVLLAVMLSLAATRAALKWVHVFGNAAEQVRGGDFDFQLDIARSDEIGRLADGFNQMILGLREGRERLMEATSKDLATGLFNHMYFHERLGCEMERVDRYEGSLCVLLLDLDRFKAINDNLGHPVGDGIIRQLASVIKQSLRGIDIAARYGGDEFAVILPEADMEAGQQVAEKLRQTVEKHVFRAAPPDTGSTANDETDFPEVNVTVTIGVVAYPEHCTTRDGIVMAADIALCRAKHVARNTVVVYDPRTGPQEGIDTDDIYQALHNPNFAALQSLAAAVDARDSYTHGHSERVADLALRIAGEMENGEDMEDSLKIAGLLHDLGKIGVPDAILNKQGSLTQEEYQVIKEHPSLGEAILRRAHQLDQIVPAVLYHHERWDGAGYPSGLAGESIPLIARVLAVADAFDAMTTDRPYRKAMSVEDALIEIRAGAGKQFDPKLAEAFLASFEQETRKAA